MTSGQQVTAVGWRGYLMFRPKTKQKGYKYESKAIGQFSRHMQLCTGYNAFRSHARIEPVNALVATVSGLARYNLPGPDRP